MTPTQLTIENQCDAYCKAYGFDELDRVLILEALKIDIPLADILSDEYTTEQNMDRLKLALIKYVYDKIGINEPTISCVERYI